MGCLSAAFRLLLLAASAVGVVLFTYFGPASWFMGFVAGIVGTLVFIALLGGLPMMLEGAGMSRKAYPAEELGDLGERQRMRWLANTGARWFLILVFAIPAALLLVVSLAYATGNANVDVPQALGLLTGVFLFMATFMWLSIGE